MLMGRRTDIINDDSEQHSGSLIRMAHESQINSNRNSDEDKLYDDPLIHDTILPHRKRVRRETLLSIQQQNYCQPQQSESTARYFKINDDERYNFSNNETNTTTTTTPTSSSPNPLATVAANGLLSLS
ncbi:unnamed protein product, partial [Rotaria magnacalcarata]